MKNFVSSKWAFIKNHRYLSIGVLLVVIGLIYGFGGNGAGNNRVTAEIGSVKESIQVIGKTKPQDSVDLGFNSSGRVAASYVKVGDKVKRGQTLAILESSDLAADLKRAESILNEEKIRLAEVSNNSPQSLSEAQQKVVQAIRQAYSLSDNAVRNSADQFFKNPRTNPRFEVVVVDDNYVHYFPVSSDLSSDVNSRRGDVERILTSWQGETLSLSTLNSQQQAQKALSYIDTIGTFMDRVAFTVNSFEYADYSYAATVNGYKASIEGARADISSARSSVVTALQALSSSPVSLNGAVSSVSIQQAKVDQAQSSVDSIRAAIGKATITAPFDGLITKEDAFAGEVASAGASVISMISESNMYIEADVSEIKIGRIALGNVVDITFDAFPGEIFMGTIVFIEPGETVVDDVANYKIRVELSGPDSRMKSGLSANLAIRIAEKFDVLVVPVYALIKEDKKYFAQKLVNGKPVKTEVSIGLVGESGDAEILSGLEAGDMLAY